MMGRLRRIAAVGLLGGLVMVLGGCSGSSSGTDPAALENVEWTVTGSSMSSVDLGKAGITAQFDGTTMSGFSGVNQYSGPYTAETDGSFD